MKFAVVGPFNQRIAMPYHMPGLSPEQTRHYVTHQLKLAGAQERILDQHALKAVHDRSFGIPRRIGAVIEPAPAYAMFDHKHGVTAEMVLKTKSLQQP